MWHCLTLLHLILTQALVALIGRVQLRIGFTLTFKLQLRCLPTRMGLGCEGFFKAKNRPQIGSSVSRSTHDRAASFPSFVSALQEASEVMKTKSTRTKI